MGRNVLVLLLACVTSTVLGTRYKHLGCFPFMDPTTEVDGLKFHYAQLYLSTCVEECRVEGYPFVALQKGQNCLCTTAYGMKNAIYGSACDITCDTDQVFTCGGMTTENIYYTLDSDAAVVDQRVAITYDSPLTFAEARKTCVQADGDLITLENILEFDALKLRLNSSGLNDSVWIGAYMNSWDAERKWSIPHARGLDVSAFSLLWAMDHPVDGDRCTLLDSDSATMKSAACAERHPFVCKQIPPLTTASPVSTADNSNITIVSPTDESAEVFWQENQLLMWVIVAIFIICYGGSCVYFTAYKIWENTCKKPTARKHRPNSRTLLVRPTNDSHIAGFHDDRAKLVEDGKSRPITPRDVSMNERETLVPPPIARTSKEKAERAKKGKHNDGFDVIPEADLIDFTKLSLTEIHYIRELLGGAAPKRQKKKKVILSA